MIKYQLIGTTFTHLTGGNKGYSVHGKVSKYIEWARWEGDAIFYLDNDMAWAEKEERKVYGWLTESRDIMPHLIDNIKKYPNETTEPFDAIFTHNQELLSLGDPFRWVPAQGTWIKDIKMYPKNKLVSMISSNKQFVRGHTIRLEWVEKLRDVVDLYGRGFNEIEFKEEGLCDYMFSVAIENARYETYFTEKILDCFATGTIPIYLGAPDVGEYFNSDGIISLTDDLEISEELYYSKQDAVKENLELVKQYEVVEDFIFERYLSGDNGAIR